MFRLIRYVLVFLTALAFVGLCSLRINTDVLKLLPDTPSLRNLEAYNRIFSTLDRFSMALVAEKEGTLLPEAADYAAFLLKESPHFKNGSARFDLLSFAEMKRAYEENLPNLLDENELQELSKRTTIEYLEKRMAEIYEQQVGLGPSSADIRYDPLQFSHIFWRKLQRFSRAFGGKIEQGYLFSLDGKSVMLRVAGPKNGLSLEQAEECRKFLKTVREKIAEKFPGIRMICIGGKQAALDNASVIRRDVAITSSVSLGLIVLLMLLFLRNYKTLPLFFLPSLFGVLIGTGMSSLFSRHVSLITLGYGAVLLGISVDYVIHYLMHLEFQNGEGHEAVMRKLIYPMSFAALSTFGSLIVLVFSDFPAHNEIGWFVGTGILASFLFVAACVPAIAFRLYSNRNRHLRRASIDLKCILEKVDRLHPGAVMSALVMLGVIGLSIFSMKQVPGLLFVSNMEQFNFLSPETRAEENRFFEIWGDQRGKAAILVTQDSFERTLQTHEKIFSRLLEMERKGEIEGVHPFLAILPSHSRMRSNHEAWKAYWDEVRIERLRGDFLSVGQRYGFSPKAFDPFFKRLSAPPDPVEISRWFPGETFEEIFGEHVKTSPSAIQHIVQAKSEEHLQKMKSRLIEEGVRVIDRKGILKETDAILREQSKNMMIFVTIFVCVLFAFYFCHPELLLIGLVPLALSLLWIFGLMAYLSIPLNIFNSLIIIFVMGLGIDYSAFRISSYLDSIGKEDPVADWASRSAILLSAITTVVGFGALMMAHHPALYSLGSCVIIAMSMVLFNALFVLPILLRYFIPPARKSHPIHFYHLVSSGWAFGMFIGNIVFLSSVVFPLYSFWRWITGKKNDKLLYLRIMERVNRSLLISNPLGNARFFGFPPRDQIRGCVAVVNHTNSVDIPMYNALPFDKVTLVKQWFWKIPFIKSLLKNAGYMALSPVQEIGEANEWFEDYRKLLVDEKINVLFFPEGTRTQSLKMGRFHLGAFRLACSAEAPVFPICFYNTRWTISRGRLIAREYLFIASALPLITPQNFDYSAGPRALARHSKKILEDEYERLAQLHVCEGRQIRLVRDCYAYMDPFFDIYLFFKFAFDRNYAAITTLLPREGKILDVGCGAGVLSNLLVYSGERRRVTGIDYCEKKIDLARRSVISYMKEALTFMHGDILEENEGDFLLEGFDGILCCDIVHYFPKERQGRLFSKLRKALKEGGTLVIRQDVEDENERCRRSFYEFLASRTGFNLFKNEPDYPSEEELIRSLCEAGFGDVRSPLKPIRFENQVILVATGIS